MTTNQPRLNVVLEADLFQNIQKLSKKQGVSMSLLARDLLRNAIDFIEDRHWVNEGEKRLKSAKGSKAVSHDDAWK